MGTITGTAIINKAATQLLDSANTRWTRTELLGWLNDGQRLIVMMQPNASSTTVPFPLAVGTRQSLPAEGWLLLDVYRNLGGTVESPTPGRAVRIVSRGILDSQRPNWHIETPQLVAKNYIYDINERDAFYVYPPNNGAGIIELNYSVAPVDLAVEEDTIEIDDIYQVTILDYMLYRACSKDAEYAPGMQLAMGYLTNFRDALGYKDKADDMNNPNKTLNVKSQAARGENS